MAIAFLAFVFHVHGGEVNLNGVVDLEAKNVQLELPAERPVVFVFLSVDCPISNRYAPTLRKLQAEFQKARWILVYPNRDETAEAIKQRLGEYELGFEAWRDLEHSLVKTAGVSVTPETAVYLKGKGWIYRGRIDDRNVDLGKQRREPLVNDLRDVLATLGQGKIPEPRFTSAVGCRIAKAE